MTQLTIPDGLDDATQFATIYATTGADGSDHPVATAIRRRVYDTGPAWQVYDTNGRLMGRVWQTRSYDWLAGRILAIVRADLADKGNEP